MATNGGSGRPGMDRRLRAYVPYAIAAVIALNDFLALAADEG